MAYGTVNVEKVTTESGYSLGAGNASSFKNRVINGGMVIDQRNSGASVSMSSGSPYILDRWRFWANGNGGSAAYTVQQSSVAPTGFSNSVLITQTAAYSPSSTEYNIFAQYIEANNVSDLGWGASGAVSVTLSFWVRSSLTGTFGGAISNSSQLRSYPFTYTINAANTWEQKTITIPGDTTGTWLKTTGIGLEIYWQLGVGSGYLGTPNAWAATTCLGATGTTNFTATNGATLYITGVQLEVGTVATSFDQRSYGTELALCQRYLPAFVLPSGGHNFAIGMVYQGTGAGAIIMNFRYPVTARVPATGLTYTGTSTNLSVYCGSTLKALTNNVAFNDSTTFDGDVVFYVAASGFTGGAAAIGITESAATTTLLFAGCEL